MKTVTIYRTLTLNSAFCTGSLFLLLVLFIGCDKKPLPTQKIEGQAFIVMKNGESLKLGGIPVLIVDSNAVMAQIDAVTKRVEAQTAMFLSTTEKSKKQFWPKPMSNQVWSEILKSTMILKGTMTDADGRFSLDVPVGKNVVIVAFGERQLLETQETYLWVLTTPTQTDVPVILNNANIFLSGETQLP